MIVLEAVKNNVHTTEQFNYESECPDGKIYAIKVDDYRFYTIMNLFDSYRDLYISKYEKKKTNKNNKKINQSLDSISLRSIEKI